MQNNFKCFFRRSGFRDLRSMTASQFRVFLSLRSRLSGHRCVIQNSFEYFCPSGAAFRGTGVSYKTVSNIFVPPEPPFGAQVCHTKQFRIFLSLRSRLSGHRCVIQNSFEYFCPSGAAFRGTGVSYKTVSNIFVPPEPPFGAQVCHTKQFRIFLSLRSRLSGLRACNAKQFRVFLSLRRRLSGLRACNAKQFRVFLSLRSRLFISFRPSKQIINIYKKKALNRQNRGTG